jgi:AraC-like DNA-binding protein/mannose-6-phosphate isomerase-like protein (cupin superfamily)
MLEINDRGSMGMKEKLIKIMQEISPEEQSYLEEGSKIRKEIYTNGNTFEIDRTLLMKEGRLITVRPHSRFIDFPEHSHNFIEIMYVCKGTITHYIEGNEIVMEEGDILFLNQQASHSVKRAEYDDIGINFIALPEFFDIPLQMLQENNVLADFLVGTLRQKQQKPQYLMFHMEKYDAIENLMENMISSMIYEKERDYAMNQYSMGLVFLYLLKHIDRLAVNSSQSYQNIVVQSTLKYINTEYQTASLGKIAADFHQSLSVLSKMIKQSTGFTFQELLQKKRFHKAVTLLLETNMSIEEIALAVGYENQSYFYRQFKNRYGMTPRKYRMNGK